jgi:hypothetical protein
VNALGLEISVLTHARVGDTSNHVYFICDAKTFRVERAKLEFHTSSDILDAGMFEFRNNQG